MTRQQKVKEIKITQKKNPINKSPAKGLKCLASVLSLRRNIESLHDLDCTERCAADTVSRSGPSWPITDDLVSCDTSDTFSDAVHTHSHTQTLQVSQT